MAAAAEFPRAVRDCPDCHHGIVWARTRTGQWMPLDAEPTDHGNVALSPGRWPVCDVIGRKATRDAMRAAGRLLYQHHRLSCPFAHRWARRPAPPRPVPEQAPGPDMGADPDPTGQVSL